jgi:hypothetical protein
MRWSTRRWTLTRFVHRCTLLGGPVPDTIMREVATARALRAADADRLAAKEQQATQAAARLGAAMTAILEK